MKIPWLVLAAVVVIGIVGFVVFASQQNKPAVTKNEESVTSQPTQNESAESGSIQPSSQYLEYSKNTLEQASNSKRVLFFYADWCPTCRPADANFKANLDKIPENVTLIRVNYNDTQTDAEEEALADKYEITYQHTFVQIDESGEVVTRWNGGQIEQLLSDIK